MLLGDGEESGELCGAVSADIIEETPTVASHAREEVAEGSATAAAEKEKAELDLATATAEAERENAELDLAIEESMDEAVRQANEDFAAAVASDKAETPLWLNPDGVVVLRLTRRAGAEEVAEALRMASGLEPCRTLVEEAGCDIRPAWANGAWILFPLTKEQLEEAGIRISAIHILALGRDEDAVREALQMVKFEKRRPHVKVETCGAAGLLLDPVVPASAAMGSDPPHTSTSWAEDDAEGRIDLVVKCTFLELRPAAGEDQSTRSAPARIEE